MAFEKLSYFEWQCLSLCSVKVKLSLNNCYVATSLWWVVFVHSVVIISRLTPTVNVTTHSIQIFRLLRHSINLAFAHFRVVHLISNAWSISHSPRLKWYSSIHHLIHQWQVASASLMALYADDTVVIHSNNQTDIVL